MTRKLAHWREHGFGIWMFRDPAGTFTGRCGIHRWRNETELGYIVKPPLWGQEVTDGRIGGGPIRPSARCFRRP